MTTGVCRYCGCTEVTPCGIARFEPGLDERTRKPIAVLCDIEHCAWVDEAATICSNSRCLDRAIRDGLVQTCEAVPIEEQQPTEIVTVFGEPASSARRIVFPVSEF